MDQTTVVFAVAVISALLGGAVGGGAALLVVDRVLKNVLKSPVILNTIEKLYQSTAPENVKSVVRDVAELLDKVTDGKLEETAGQG